MTRPYSPQDRARIQQWYGSVRWKNRREAHLAEHPICEPCRKVGKVSPGRVVDHVERHRGDYDKFWNGALQTLCQDCDSLKQQHERGRRYHGTNNDGTPIDPRHPWNQ